MPLENLKLVFLCETKSFVHSLQFLKIQLRFDHLFGVDASGQSGGLCLLWKEDCNINILSSSRSRIDAEFEGVGDLDHWRFTGFY